MNLELVLTLVRRQSSKLGEYSWRRILSLLLTADNKPCTYYDLINLLK